MRFEPTAIADVVLIQPTVFADTRGFFFESWQQRDFEAAGLPMRFVQDNHSRSMRHVLRGLHYQLRKPQGKLVRVTRGEVFDVAVDLRKDSPTFRQWVGKVLSDENHHMLWVPPGFAHGFLVLSESADFLYRVTEFWAPADEHTLAWNDPGVGIRWPLPPGVEPKLSPKDSAAARMPLAECFA